MENVYAKSFEKKWYATTPLPALITTQGRCLNPAYAKADQKKDNNTGLHFAESVMKL